MNHCVFTGYLVFDPSEGLNNQSSSLCCTFKLITYEYVRNKNGIKKRYPTILTFQAWDSGANTIAKFGKKGMKMTIMASARNNIDFETEPSDSIIFRVNQFDFGCLEDKE